MEAEAWVREPPVTASDEGELVESGTFRVDRQKMLETLSRYQLPRPEDFFNAWARCAVVSGAADVRLYQVSGETGHGFEVSFDGRPFTREELCDPYAGLLAGDRDRNAYLAAGLLALFRTGPRSITISSAEAGVVLKGVLDQAASPASRDGRNVLCVVWEAEPRELSFDRLADLAGSVMLLSPIPVRCSGKAGKSFAELRSGRDGLFFEEGGRRGWLAPLDHDVTPLTGFHPEQDSTLGIHTLGAYVETHKLRLPLVPIAAEINDDALNLDASFGKCVRDRGFAELAAFVEKQAGALLLREIKAQKLDLAEVGARLNSPVFVGLWRARMKWFEAWTAAVSNSDWRSLLPPFLRGLFRPPAKIPAEGFKFYRTGSRAWWLQDACRRVLKGHTRAPDNPVLLALWEAPVLLSARRGALLSLDSIHRRLVKGRLAVSKRVIADNPNIKDVVWLASFRDERFLNEWVPRANWDLF